ncbi:YggS family pyridoxal phosphate enzyme [Ruminococcus sp. HUN007]|uniref:YggS family pyridoxal phosphate enzyme n=1 Tax=Ruminococcus sp. HUN007 TaxID=1514668 RepID=UPI000A9EEBFE
MKTQFDYVDDNYRRIIHNVNEAKERFGRSGDDIQIMAVTKTVDAGIVNHAVSSCGIKLLGENRVQEYLSKKDEYLPASVHFIGGLQTNKVKYIIDSVDMIQSVDSLKLAAEIDRHAGRVGRVMDVLAEVNIGGELSKGGVSPEELPDLLKSMAELPNIKVKGLMTIPPPQDPEKISGKNAGIIY